MRILAQLPETAIDFDVIYLSICLMVLCACTLGCVILLSFVSRVEDL